MKTTCVMFEPPIHQSSVRYHNHYTKDPTVHELESIYSVTQTRKNCTIII